MAGVPPNFQPPQQIVPYAPWPVDQMGFPQYMPDYWERVREVELQRQRQQHMLHRELGPPLFNPYMGAVLRPLINFHIRVPPNMPRLPRAPLHRILEKMRLEIYRAHMEAYPPRIHNSPDRASSSSSGVGSRGTPQQDNIVTLMVTDRLTTNTHFVRVTQEDLTHHLNANCSLCKLQESLRVGERLQGETSSLALTRSNGGNLYCFQRVINKGFLDFGVRSVMLNGDRSELCLCKGHKLTKLFVLVSKGVLEVNGFLCPVLRGGYLSEQRKNWTRPIHHPNNRSYLLLKQFQEMFPDQSEVDFYVTIKDYQRFKNEVKTHWVHPLVPPPTRYVFELDVRYPTRAEELQEREDQVLENHRRAMRLKFAEIAALKKERNQLKNLLQSLLDTENFTPEARLSVEIALGLHNIEPAVEVDDEVLEDQQAAEVEEVARRESVEAVVIAFDFLETEPDSAPGDEEPVAVVEEADTGLIAPSDFLILPTALALDAEPTQSSPPVHSASAIFVNVPEYPAASTSGTSAADVQDVVASPAHSRRSTDGPAWLPVGEYHPPETMTVSSVGQTVQVTPAPKWKGKADEKFRVANNKERLELTNFNFF